MERRRIKYEKIETRWIKYDQMERRRIKYDKKNTDGSNITQRWGIKYDRTLMDLTWKKNTDGT